MDTEREEIVAQVRDEVMKELGTQGGPVDIAGMAKSFDRLVSDSRVAWEVEMTVKWKTKAAS